MVKMTSEQEETANHSPQDEQTYNEDTEDSSDFIVIGDVPCVTMLNNSVNHLPDLQFSVNSVQSDLSPDDIQQWLTDLLKENQELKASLEKTNITMKQQFQALQAWEEQFASNCQQYKTVIADYQKGKLKLEEDNEQLKITVEKLTADMTNSTDKGKCEELQEKINQISVEIEESKKCQEEKRLELEKLNTENMSLQKIVSELRENIKLLEKKSKHLEEEKKELLTMNGILESKLKKESPSSTISSIDYSFIPQATKFANQSTSNSIEEKSSSNEITIIEANKLESASLLMHEEQTKVSQLTQQLAEQQLQVSKLQLALDEKESEVKDLQQKLHSIATTPLEKQQGSLASELKISEEKFQMLSVSAQRYKEKCDSLYTWLQVYQEKLESVRLNDTAVIEQLQLEITTLRQMLAEEQATKLEDKKNLEEARKQFEHLLTEYKKDELEAWKQIESRRYQETLDKIMATVVEKDEEISKLKDEITKLNVEIERIPILEAQLHLFKQDFDDESSARVKAQKEVECLKADLQAMYTAKEKLAEELNNYSKCSGHQRKHRSDKKMSQCSQESSSSQQQSTQGQGPYICPKCNFCFSELQALCNHVEDCITDDPFN